MLSIKQGDIKYHFLSLWYGRPRMEPHSLGPLANTLTIIPMDTRNYIIVYIGILETAELYAKYKLLDSKNWLPPFSLS